MSSIALPVPPRIELPSYGPLYERLRLPRWARPWERTKEDVAVAAIAKVGDVGANYNANVNGSNQVALTGRSFSAGNLVVIRALANSDTATISSITDGAGNAWAQAKPQNTVGDITTVYIWYTLAANALAAGAITIQFSSFLAAFVHVAEFSGIAAAPLDQVAGAATAFGTPYSSGNTPATTLADELLIGVAGNGGASTSTPGGGFTEETDFNATGPGRGFTDGYRIVAATGAYAYSGTWSSSDSGPVAIATFKAAAGGAAPSKVPQIVSPRSSYF